MKIRTTMLASALAICTFSLGGCTTAENPGEVDRDGLYQSPDASTAPESADVDPFDQFVLTYDQEQIVTKARDKLAAACMKELGFTYEPVFFPEIDESNAKYDAHWGPLDPESALASGYTDPGPVTVGNDAAQPPAPEQGTQDMKAYTDALAGTSPDDPGCMGQAIAQINEPTQVPTDADWQEYDRLLKLANYGAADDPKMKEVVLQWSTCMAEAGYTYSSPVEPITDAWDAKVDDTEQQTAFADATCKQKVELMQMWRSTLRSHQETVVADNLPFFESMRDFELGRLQSAQAILGQSG